MSSSWQAQQVVYAVFSGLGSVVAYVPLYWHLEAWNMGSVLWIFWAGTGCLIQCINAIIWVNDTVNRAPVWCEIVTRFIHAQPIGIVVASALMNYRLYRITSMSSAFTSRADRRRAGAIDLAVGLGVPTIFICLYWFVQGHRFDILEGVGCFPTTPNTTVLLFTYRIWPVVIMVVSASYGVLTVRSFLLLRKDLELLPSQSSSLTSYRYLRLMLFASLDALFLLPLNVYFLYLGGRQPLYAWKGLADLHFSFSSIGQFPVSAWRSSQSSIDQVMLIPCTSIAACFVFFAFFGLAEEAREHYRKVFDCCFRSFTHSTRKSRDGRSNDERIQYSRKTRGALSHLSIPSFIQRGHPAQNRRDSLSSTLSTVIMVDGGIIYDSSESHKVRDVNARDSYFPPSPSYDAIGNQTGEAGIAPARPPGLSPIPPCRTKEPSRRAVGALCVPPNHAPNGSGSTCLTSFGSVV